MNLPCCMQSVNTVCRAAGGLRRKQVCQWAMTQADNDYNSLKMAKMMEISDGDLQGAKDRLSKLIREVNKCISMLQGD